MIHVCFGFTDKTGRYSKFVGTSMLSIFENSYTPPPSIAIHILHDDTLTDDNREKFLTLTERYNQLVEFYNVAELCADKIDAIKQAFPLADRSRFSVAMFYRFFIPDVLPADAEKAIYLDADTVVNLDINELWQIDLGENVIGGVTVFSIRGYCGNLLCEDNLVAKEDYINSGVVLMNLRLLRKEEATVMNGIKFIGESPRYGRLSDQDTLNYCFASRILKLPAKFNKYLPKSERKLPLRPQIYHYAAHALNLNMNLNYNRLWFEYFAKTPWFDAEKIIVHFYDELIKVRSMLQDKLLATTAMMLGKSRAFFVEPARVDAMKKFFAIRNDELIIPAENENSVQKLLEAMKAHKGKCVFFIMTPTFLKKKFPLKLLLKARFVEGVDFVKGWELLPLEKGGVFNSHSIVSAL